MVVVAAAATYATRGLAWGEHKQGRELRALACTFLATNYSLYYFFWVVETPVLRFHRTFWNVSIMEKARLLRRPFWPLFWMTNRHLQTVVGSIAGDLYWMFRKPVTYDRQEVTAFDGSSLQLDWYANNDAFADPDQPYGDGLTNLSFMAQSSHFVRQSMRRVATTLKLRASSMDSKSAQDMATLLTAGVAMDSFNGGKADLANSQLENGLPFNAPVVMVLHGIGGTAHDPYVKRLVVACSARAWRPVVYSYWRLDWADPRDMESAVAAVARRFPQAPIFVVAFSAGAHVLVTYLAHARKNTPVVAAVTVSGCLDFVRTWHYVEQTQSPLYQRSLTDSIRTCVRRHRDKDVRVRHRKEEWNPILSGCQRANILYDRHIALVPEFSGHDKLAGTKFYNMADPRDEKWVHGTTKETARDRKGTPFPLPQTKPTYDRPARILVDKIEVTLLVGGGG